MGKDIHDIWTVPFAADFGGVAPTEIKNMTISETDLSFNGDGIKDSALLAFTLTGNVSTNFIEIWDIENPNGGAYGDGYIGYLHAANSLAAGSYTLNVNGGYYPWSGEPRTVIPDGLYTIDFNATSATGPVGNYVGPVVVKTTKPIISGAVIDGIVEGQITDKYIDYNSVLARYGLDYELNEKLSATYVLTENGVDHAPVSIVLNQDGSYHFDVSTLNEQAQNIVTIHVQDAAGNTAQQVIYESEPVNTESATPAPEESESAAEADDAGEEKSSKVEQTPTPSDEKTPENDTEMTEELQAVKLATTAKAMNMATLNQTFMSTPDTAQTSIENADRTIVVEALEPSKLQLVAPLSIDEP